MKRFFSVLVFFFCCCICSVKARHVLSGTWQGMVFFATAANDTIKANLSIRLTDDQTRQVEVSFTDFSNGSPNYIATLPATIYLKKNDAGHVLSFTGVCPLASCKQCPAIFDLKYYKHNDTAYLRGYIATPHAACKDMRADVRLFREDVAAQLGRSGKYIRVPLMGKAIFDHIPTAGSLEITPPAATPIATELTLSPAGLTEGARLMFSAPKKFMTDDAANNTLTVAQMNAIFADTKWRLTADKTAFIADEYCTEDLVPPHTEFADLNGDGKPEIVLFYEGVCLAGNTAAGNIIYAQNASGKYYKVYDELGMVAVTKDKTKGYADLLVGVPGFEYPVFKWDGSKYVRSGTATTIPR